MISADRPNEDYSEQSRIVGTSGRPNKTDEVFNTYTDSSTPDHGTIPPDVTLTYLTKRFVFEHKSMGSPRDENGKLLIRSNPYERLKIEESIGVVRIAGSAAGYGSFVAHQSLNAYGGGYYSQNHDQLEKAAIAKARTKFREEVHNANANIALALIERKEIFETIMTLTWKVFVKIRDYKRLIDSIQSMKDAKKQKERIKRVIGGVSVKGMSKTKDTFADLWLFFIYGVMPIILDVNTMLKHVKKIDGAQVHGRARKSFDESRNISDGYWATIEQKQGFVSCHVTGFVSIVDPIEKLLSEYGFTNIGTLLWERIPYSFLIDWIIGIGSWINSLSALDGTIVTNYNETVTSRTGMNLSDFRSIDYGGWTISATIINPHTVFFEKKNRMIYDKPPLPPLQFGSNLDWRRLLTSVSLLNQQLKKLT